MSELDPDKAAPEPPRGLFDPAPASGPEPHSAVAAAKPARRGGTPLPVTLLLTAALGGAGYWAWMHPPAGAAPAAQGSAQLQALSERLDALDKRAGAISGDAAAAFTKKVEDLSARVDALGARQDQVQAEAAKAVEIATQRPGLTQDAPAQPDGTAQEVPGLIAQQEASDKTKVGQAGSPPPPADMKAALDTVDQRLAKLELAAGQAQAQVQSDAGAKPQSADLSALDSRVAKLEQQAAQPPEAKTPQADSGALSALDGRLARLEQAEGQATSQTDAAEKAQQGDTATLAALGDRLAKLEQASGQVQSADEAAQKAQATDTQTLAALDGRVARLEQTAGQAQGEASFAARDATRAIRLEAAAAALQAGEPLGALPDAPPALARYANTAPPTEAALRAGFPRVAEAARAASQPNTANRSFLDRAFARLQQSVVVRQGDHVVVGDPAAGVIARAQASVSAGDLKGAADTLGALTGAAADAVRPWVEQARGLLDARAALATMAAHG